MQQLFAELCPPTPPVKIGILVFSLLKKCTSFFSESYRGTSIGVTQCRANNEGSNDRSNLLPSPNPCQPRQLLYSAAAVFVSGVKQTGRKNCHIICNRRQMYKKAKTHLHSFPGEALYSLLHVKLENQPLPCFFVFFFFFCFPYRRKKKCLMHK